MRTEKKEKEDNRSRFYHREKINERSPWQIECALYLSLSERNGSI